MIGTSALGFQKKTVHVLLLSTLLFKRFSKGINYIFRNLGLFEELAANFQISSFLPKTCSLEVAIPA